MRTSFTLPPPSPPVNLCRFDENVLALSLVATHLRDSLVVTSLALSPRPVYPPPVNGKEGNNNHVTNIPLVALADRTTRTVAVLACSRVHRGSTKARVANNDAADGLGSGGGVVEGRGSTMRDGGGIADGAGSPSGSPVNVVDQLRLLAVWPCNEKVTSLAAAASGVPLSTESYDDGNEHDDNGQERQYQQQQQQQQNQQHQQQRTDDRRSRLSGGSRRIEGDNFFLGTASGTVLTFGVDASSFSLPE